MNSIARGCLDKVIDLRKYLIIASYANFTERIGNVECNAAKLWQISVYTLYSCKGHTRAIISQLF